MDFLALLLALLFPSENSSWQFLLLDTNTLTNPLSKYHPTPQKSTNIFNSILQRNLQNDNFKKKFIEMHIEITLFNFIDKNTFISFKENFNGLFEMLKIFQTYRKQTMLCILSLILPEIKQNLPQISYAMLKEEQGKFDQFQKLFDGVDFKQKHELFTFWCVKTFPDLNPNDFLDFSIIFAKRKIAEQKGKALEIEKIFQDVFPQKPFYKDAYTKSILVKTYEYLNEHDETKKQKLLEFIKRLKSLYEYFLSIHFNITLPNSPEYVDNFKYLFDMLNAFLKDKNSEISKFKEAFEKNKAKDKAGFFSNWLVRIFPHDKSIKNFLVSSIELTQMKIEASKIETLKNIFNLIFSKNLINPNATLILTKIWQYLDPENGNQKEKQNILRKIAQSCYTKITFPYLKLKEQKEDMAVKKFRCNFSKILKITDDKKIFLIYYQIPQSNIVVALTSKNAISNQENKRSIEEKHWKIYCSETNDLACILLIPEEKIKPLNNEEVSNLKNIKGRIIMTPEEKFGVDFIYSPVLTGGIYFLNDPLEEIIKGNEDLFEKIKYDFQNF